MREVYRLLILSFTCLILLGAFAVGNSLGIGPDSVAGAWLFDEGDGDVATDSSRNGNNAQIIGPQWVDGMFNKALSFSGASDYVDCGNDPSLDLLDNLSIVVWVNHNQGNDGYIIMKNDSGDGVRQYGFLDYPSTCGGINFYCETAGGRGDFCFAGSGVDDGTWHHVALVIDYPDIKLFLDGKIQDTRKLPSNMRSVNSSVWIGKRKPNNYPFSGIIDEVAIFNVSISEDDINRIMNEGLARAALAVSPAGKLASLWGTVKKQWD